MAWNQSDFDDALRRKYDILGQNAASETTKANAAMLNVQQQPELQDSANAAAMNRAQLMANTQLQTTSMNNKNALDVANTQGNFGLRGREMASKNALDVANVQGGYGLQEAQIKARQPEFGMITDPVTGEAREYGRNQSARDILKNEMASRPRSFLPNRAPSYTSSRLGLGLGLPGFRQGGVVAAGQPIVVGEDGQEKFVPVGGLSVPVGRGGPEVIVPRQDGVIVPNSRTATARTGPLTQGELEAARGEILGGEAVPSNRVAGLGYQTTVPETTTTGGLPMRRQLSTETDHLGVLEGNGDGPITLNGREIDPGSGRIASLPGGTAQIWTPQDFHTQLGRMRTKDEQLAAYAGLSPERRQALRQWMGSQQETAQPRTDMANPEVRRQWYTDNGYSWVDDSRLEDGGFWMRDGRTKTESAAPEMAPSHRVGGLPMPQNAQTEAAPLSAVDTAKAGVSWAVNRPRTNKAAPEVQAVVDAVLPVARRGGEAGVLYSSPADLARAGVVNAVGGMVRPVVDVGGRIVHNFSRAVRGLPTYVDEEQPVVVSQNQRSRR